jgi:glycosyltransferase involved in cell wall biosynthesis
LKESPTISLCMIVNNEESFIRKCLQSVFDLVDEIIIVDTGSTDNTVQICNEYNAIIIPYEWDYHFANARNRGLVKATGEWILWLDADEEFDSNNKYLLKKYISQTKSNFISLPIYNYYGETLPVNAEQVYIYHQLRLFRNHIGINFINRIHENPQLPAGSNSNVQEVQDIHLPIHHYGYIDDITKQKKKSSRNRYLLQLETSNDDPWIKYHLASEYYREKKYDEAFKMVNQSIIQFLLKGNKPPSILYRLKYGMLIETNSIDGAWPSIEKALLLFPDYVDLHFFKGYILYQKGDFTEALSAFDKCLELGEEHTEHLILKGVGSTKALKYKDLCLKALKIKTDIQKDEKPE